MVQARWRGSHRVDISAHMETCCQAQHCSVLISTRRPERRSGSTDLRVQRARTQMDTPKNGQLHRNAGRRPRRSAGWLARAALSAAFLFNMAFSCTAFAQDQQLPVVTAAKPVVRE